MKYSIFQSVKKGIFILNAHDISSQLSLPVQLSSACIPPSSCIILRLAVLLNMRRTMHKNLRYRLPVHPQPYKERNPYDKKRI